ncbi:hypothetical protein [Streptomyces sp. NPDC050988]|uniref:DUF6197 family protein n=1 Tax=Streptomyces sp. NPDC050988 TaxID=3365637 RepID=UPI00379A4C89
MTTTDITPERTAQILDQAVHRITTDGWYVHQLATARLLTPNMPPRATSRADAVGVIGIAVTSSPLQVLGIAGELCHAAVTAVAAHLGLHHTADADPREVERALEAWCHNPGITATDVVEAMREAADRLRHPAR